MTLADIIAESPYQRLPQTFWMYPTAETVAGNHVSQPWSITTDGFETTKVAISETKPENFPNDGYGPLTVFRLKVSKPFAAPGFLAAACTAVASRDIAVLVISTITFDYLFVRTEARSTAEAALQEHGFVAEEG